MYQRTPGVIDADFIPVMGTSPPPSVPEPAADSSSLLKSLLSRIRHTDLKSDDLLLAAILYFTLRESEDDELLWIVAALFLTGVF